MQSNMMSLPKSGHFLVFFISLVSAFSLGGILFASATASWLVNAANASLFAMALWRPSVAISIFILVPLPLLGGQYAGSPLNQDFGQLYSTLIAALGMRWLFEQWRKPSSVILALDNPLGLLMLLCVLTIPGSFISLPYDELMVRIRQQLTHSDWLLYSPKEVFILYPLVKGFQMLQNLALFYLILNSPKSWRTDPRQWILSLLLSIILVIGVGILDYYNIIDLRGFRPLDLVRPIHHDFNIKPFDSSRLPPGKAKASGNQPWNFDCGGICSYLGLSAWRMGFLSSNSGCYLV